MTTSSVLQASFQCSAKINWDLHITGVRPDGYHELDSIVAPINLFDKVSISISKGIGITVESPVCPGRDNICHKAAELLCGQYGIWKRIQIKIIKNIPTGAGLGGGSSDAACVLKGLSQMLGLDLTVSELTKTAMRIGADVPCFLYKGWRRMRGIGEIVDKVDHGSYHIILLKPEASVSTAQAYRLFDQMCRFTEPEGYRYGNPQNDLRVPAALIVPEISDAVRDLESCGASPVQMTGSGSCCFGAFKSGEEADFHAKRLSKKWQAWSLIAGA